MVIRIDLNNRKLKVFSAIAVLCVSMWLAWLTLAHFVVGTLTDDRHLPSRETLEAAHDFFPDSARLAGRLASVEVTETDNDLSLAEGHTWQAIRLSPYDYHYFLTLALINEMAGDNQLAEDSLREAIKLAPNNSQAHWRFGNLLLREGKLDQAVDELRMAATDPHLLPAALDLIGRASNNDLGMMLAVTPDDARSRFLLAHFLLGQSSDGEAVSVLSSMQRATLLASPESFIVLNTLIDRSQLRLAHLFWEKLMSERESQSLISNGGFEITGLKSFEQFDWTFGRSDYARIKVESGQGHTGEHALRIDFTGRDTTRLDKEISQLLVLRPGRRYRLECYAKAENLSTPEGPRVVIADGKTSDWLATSPPVATQSATWQRLQFSRWRVQRLRHGQTAAALQL